MRRLLTGVLLALVAGVLPPGVSRGADRELGDAPFEIEADRLVYEQDRNVYEASGNVRVTQADGRSLSAEWVTFNADTRLGVAVGDVELRDGTDVLRADFATVDFNTLTAMATHASVDAGSAGFLVSGEAVRRTGPNTYDVKNGTFTTCRCPPPDDGPVPWDMTASQADVEVEGYAVARNVTFRVLGVPVLYTPWMMLPVMTGRKTGLLMPEFEISGRNGTTIGVPFFWAAAPWLNLTFRPQWVSKRGFKGGVEAEYVFGEEGWGEGGFTVLANDRDVRDEDVARDYSPDRWAYWLRHEQPMPDGLRFGTDINVASDNDFVVDFEDLGSDRNRDRFLDSSAWATWAEDSLFASAVALFNDDVQSPNNLDRDDWMLQRLPQVDLGTLSRRLGDLPLFGAVDLQYTYFWQADRDDTLRGISSVGDQFFDTGRDGVFDFDEPLKDGSYPDRGPGPPVDVHGDDFLTAGGPEGDGVFQEGELLADYGHRFDLYPKLTVPHRFGPVETLVEGGFRETFYAPHFGDSEHREVWTGRFDSRMRFARDFELRGTPLRHVVEPRLAFTIVESDDQDDNPLFIPQPEITPRRLADGDPRVLTRDPSDRIEDQRVLQLSADTRFYGKRLAGATGAREVAALRLGGGYDFEGSRMTQTFLEGLVMPSEDLRLEGLLGYDTKKRRVGEALAQLGWRSDERYQLRAADGVERRHAVRFQYRFLRDRNRLFQNWLLGNSDFTDFDDDLTRVDQLNMGGRFPLGRQFDLLANGYYSFESSETRGGSIGVLFLSSCGCWDLGLRLEHRTRPSDTRFQFALRLAGLGGKE
ncbi:MAG: LPS-assembly protein LptD [Deltaproteobacteria bacterium]|nr:LPS-assembly protein LptD [Deltaproteobacteria bacterium]